MRSIVVRLCNDTNSGKHFVHIEAFHSGFLVFCTDDTEQQNEENDTYITLNKNKNKMAFAERMKERTCIKLCFK